MSYIVPSVLVYQQLAASGGVANINPDLDACIIGPAYNVVQYQIGVAAAYTLTRAVDVNGNPASITNNTVTYAAYLSSTKPGQVVDSTSIQVYLNNAQIQTKQGRIGYTAGSNVLTCYSGSNLTVSTINGSKTVTVITNTGAYFINDVIDIVGAGVGGADLIATILAINTVAGTTTYTLDTAASVTIAAPGASAHRIGFNNLNPLTSDLRISPGDTLVLTGAGQTLFTSVLSLVSSNNIVTQILAVDSIPSTFTPTNANVSCQKLLADQLIPAVFNSLPNYDATQVNVTGAVTIEPYPTNVEGLVITGDVYIGYNALRTDLSGAAIEIDTEADLQGFLGVATDANPLGLAVQLALSNTIGRIFAIAIPSNDLPGYTAALELAENLTLFALCPLTQELDILEAFQIHVQEMSTPVYAAWRIALVNTAIPTLNYIGQYNPNYINNTGATLALDPGGSGKYILNCAASTFVSDGVVPGDTVVVTGATGTPTFSGSLTVLGVISNQQMFVSTPTGSGTYTAVRFYVERTLSKTQQATAVAATSTSFGSSRMYHVQPDLVGVNVGGVVKYLPGYYLCAALCGLISGLPAQQGLTNIGLAGISDLLHSNFYFPRANLDTMAGAGTFLVVQATQGGLPYVRHSLSTDMSVLEYRELQQVKNIDYLSYYFYDILQPFPGRYNITPDTLQILRTTINAAGTLLQGRVLPKIGPPLLTFSITSLIQDPNNLDQVIINLPVTIPTVMNYVNLYLIV